MIARRVNREAVVVLGWGRAILMQLAHPLVAAGVGAHSGFDAGPLAYLGRMRRTVSAMLSLTFGSESEIRRTAERINAVHRRVHGRLDDPVGPYPAGTPYDATDPALLTWVHATLVDSQLRTYKLFVGPLTAAEEDRYCAEAARVGPLLGAAPGVLPATRDALDRYLHEMQQAGGLAVGGQARRLASALLALPGGPWAAPARWLGRLTTIGLLPAPLRDGYGYVWGERDARQLRAAATALRAARRIAPRIMWEWPAARSGAQGAHSAPRRERRGAQGSPQADAGGSGRSPV